MQSLVRGDIVIAYFPQEDQDFSDLRPCLVLSVDPKSFLAAKITTTELRQVWTHRLHKGDSDTAKGRILKDSWVNLRRRENILLVNAKSVVASLKPEVFEVIISKLGSFLVE
jgi:hypothetical protein